MRFILLLLISILIIGSCKKHPAAGEDMSFESIWQCHDKNLLDSAATINKLEGSWKLLARTCGWVGNVPLNGIVTIITFNKNGIFSMMQDGQIADGTWKLTKISNSYWRVDITTQLIFIMPALGTVAFCGDYATFDNGFAADGCISMFKKI